MYKEERALIKLCTEGLDEVKQKYEEMGTTESVFLGFGGWCEDPFGFVNGWYSELGVRRECNYIFYLSEAQGDKPIALRVYCGEKSEYNYVQYIVGLGLYAVRSNGGHRLLKKNNLTLFLQADAQAPLVFHKRRDSWPLYRNRKPVQGYYMQGGPLLGLLGLSCNHEACSDIVIAGSCWCNSEIIASPLLWDFIEVMGLYGEILSETEWETDESGVVVIARSKEVFEKYF